jgi:hypothetical protein
VADRCECGLPLDPPTEGGYYWASLEQPDDDLATVVRYGEHPRYRRAVRVPAGWMLRGASVERPGRPDVILRWECIGMCWADTEHPVVAADHG